MLAIEISHKSGKLTKMSDIVNHLLDNYLQEAKQDLLHNAEIQVRINQKYIIIKNKEIIIHSRL